MLFVNRRSEPIRHSDWLHLAHRMRQGRESQPGRLFERRSVPESTIPQPVPHPRYDAGPCSATGVRTALERHVP